MFLGEALRLSQPPANSATKQLLQFNMLLRGGWLSVNSQFFEMPFQLDCRSAVLCGHSLSSRERARIEACWLA